MFRITCVLVVFASFLSYVSGRDVALQPFSPNAQEGFSVVLAASPEPISALQFDLEFDGSAGLLFPSPGSATRGANKMLTVQNISADRKRFVVYGLNGSGIEGGSLTDVAFSPRQPVSVRLLDVRAVYGNGSSAPLDVRTATISLKANASVPLTASGVWNAASGHASAVSGGAIMTLRGMGIGPDQAVVPASGPVAPSLGGYQVSFDGRPAPLLYAGPDQINVIAPWATTNRDTTRIVVTKNSALVAEINASVADTTPEIFTLSSTGAGAASAINQDGTVNTPMNPAPVGSYVSLYGTGLGPLSPAGLDGGVAHVAYANSQVSVLIDGIPAEVTYAGSAPSLVWGVFQVNFRIPEGVSASPSVDVRVRAGEAQSAAGVTISVR